MATIANGTYRISNAGELFLTAPDPQEPVVLRPPMGDDGDQAWEVQSAARDTCTIRLVSHPGAYLSFEEEPDPFEPVRLATEPREWKVTASEVPNAFVIGLPDSELTLGIAPVLVFPPRIALSPPYRLDRGWVFESLK